MAQFFVRIWQTIATLGRLWWLKLTLIYAIVLATAQWTYDLSLHALETMGSISPDTFVLQFDQVSQYLDLANHFFPVVEVWALITSTIPYVLAVLVFRFVKQFIPTLSN